MTGYDERTIEFYNKEAAKYAARREAVRSPGLDAFITHVGGGAKVLELGCGGGQDAEIMLAAGIILTPTDASPGLAAQAALRLGREVAVMRFDELEAEQTYDGVWASACLLHVPAEALPETLRRIWRALKPGGLFFASYKAGDGADRDSLGRYYNFPTKAELERAYRSAGAWSPLVIEEGEGGGYDGVARTWLLCSATRA